MTMASLGGLLVLGMTLYSSMRKGQAVKSGDWGRAKSDPSVKSLSAPKPKLNLIPVTGPDLKQAIIGAGYRSTLLYVWNSKCLRCGDDLKNLQRMKVFYEPYKIGIASLVLDPPQLNEYLVNYFTHFSFTPSFSLYQRQDLQPAFLREIHAEYTGVVPAFFVYNRIGEVVDMWTGPTSIRDVDARFRQSFNR